MRVYNQGIQSFEKFCNENYASGIRPISVQAVVEFIAHLFKSGLKHSTIRCYISGLSFYCKINNLEDNTNVFIVKKLLDGAKRLSVTKGDPRLPITRDLLSRILSIVGFVTRTNYETLLFKAAFSLCFHGMFRVGELTISDSKYVNHAVKLKDVKFVNGGIEVFLKTSKTDQFGEGVTMFISSQPNHKQLCPVAALALYLPLHPQRQEQLFCHYDGTPLSKYQFSAVLKRALSYLGDTDVKITSHSFRIGMATQCAIDGFSDEEIKRLGRWKSGVYLRYIRIP